MTRLLLLNDSLDHGNWGSQACAAELRRILLEQVPGAEIDAVPSHWIKRRYAFDPHFRGARLFKKAEFPQKLLFREHQVLPVVADEFETVAALWQQGRGGGGAAEFTRRLAGVDAVVYNAEGSAYRTNYTAIKSLFLLWVAKSGHGLPCFFLNGSVTLTDTEPILPGMIRKVFGAIDGVTVREPNSLRIVREWVPEADVELVPDSVFHLPPPGRERSPRVAAWLRATVGDRPYFCFSLSMLPTDLRRFREGSATLELIQRLKRLVPDAVLMARDGKDQFLRAVAEQSGSHFFGGDFDYREATELLEGASLLCSGRYHHVILATIAGCPSLPMKSTSPKVQGLCQLLGDAVCPPFDPTDLRPRLDAVLEAARGALSQGAALRERLRKRADALRPQTARMGELVRERLEARA